ncbi:unnamed protein product [Pedinophyceae sp. YPF-701]|nr:unnamed protein product [Pedinophyceae sp. YPF-701]
MAASQQLSAQEIAACTELGLDPDRDSDLVWVAQDMVREENLPQGWSMYLHAESGRHFYCRTGASESVWEHPLLDFYRGAVFMERGGWRQLQHDQDISPPNDEEMQAMGQYMEVDPGEDPYVLEVVKMAINAPMPPGWREVTDADGETVFENKDAGERQTEHPLDPFFFELLRRRRLELTHRKHPFSRDGLEAVKSGAWKPSVSRVSSATSSRQDLSPTAGDSVRGNRAPSRLGGDASKAALQTTSRRRRSSSGVPAAALASQQSEVDAGVRGGSSTTEAAEDAPPEDDYTDADYARMAEDEIGANEGSPPQVGKSERVVVVVRARPMHAAKGRRMRAAWDITGQNGREIRLIQDGTVALKHQAAFYGGAANIGARYVFEHGVFTPEHNTHHLYNGALKHVVAGAIAGINGTLFAYGQTGSGKTYTIVGTSNAPGVVPIAAEDLFMQVQQEERAGKVVSVRMGILEIYNEEINDLLAPKPVHTFGEEKKRELKIVEDPLFGIRIQGLIEETVESPMRMTTLLAKGMSRRVVGQTRMNDKSSRSHVLTRLTLEIRDGQSPVRVSSLNFVDLAGSERLAKSGAQGKRAEEASNINLSLLMLGNVISKLSEGKSKDFIPYRNSKLTRILQPSLGGNARTAVVACIDTSMNHCEETSMTLKFAARAANITNTIRVNELSQGQQATGNVRKYQKMIEVLQNQLREFRAGKVAEENTRLKKQVEKLTEENDTLKLQVERAKVVATVGGDAGAKPGATAGDGDLTQVPATPPGLDLPQISARQGKITLRECVAAIARVTQIGKVGGTGFAAEADPQEVVAWVRMMRAERDELRRQLARAQATLREQGSHLSQADKVLATQHVIEEATLTLENLVGSQLDAQPRGKSGKVKPPTLGDRLQEAVEAAVMMSSEMTSMARQNAATLAMLAEADEKRAAMSAELDELRPARQQLIQAQKQLAALSDAKAHAEAQRDEVARRHGARIPERPDRQPGLASQKFAEQVEAKYVEVVERMSAQLMQVERDVDKYRNLLRQHAGAFEGDPWDPSNAEAAEMGDLAPHTLFGSAAIRAARQAIRRARNAEERARQLTVENEELAERLSAVTHTPGAKEEVAGAKGGEGEAMDRLKKRVYALSREVALLTRERDDLLGLMGLGAAPRQSALDTVAMHNVENGAVVPGSAAAAALWQQLAGAEERGPTQGYSPAGAGPTLVPIASLQRGNGQAKPRKGADGSGHLPDIQQGKSRSRLAGGPSSLTKAGKSRKKATGKGGWSDASAKDYSEPPDALARKKRLVARERARKEAVAAAQVESKVAQMQLQLAQKKAAEQQAALQEMLEENARLRNYAGFE